SEVADQFRVRAVAFYGFPDRSGKKVPGILHIHGGGQTATKGYVEYWARRGYAAMSINWGSVPIAGEPEPNNTDWGPLAAAQSNVANTYKVRPEPKINSWYHWAIACRRALTFLEQQPEVDASRLAIFGISMGGRLTWLVAGLDTRIKAAVSV